jgi:hypothetical protein
MRILLLLLISISLVAQSSEDTKSEHIKLFNGKNLNGWKSIGSARWKVENGVIVGGQEGDPSRSGILLTEGTFKDFDLSLEFKIDEHGKYNSGIYFRKSKTKALGHPYQLNIGRGAADEPVGLHLDGWLDKGDEDDSIRKPLQWNKLRIRAVGPLIKAWLNEKLIVEYKDPSPRKDLLEPGAIGIQTYGAEGHSGWVKFREIHILNLSKK